MSKTVVVTHEGRAHADELLATWFMQVLTGGDMALVRTSDETLMRAADILLDCGGVYNPLLGRYDHHGNATVPRAPRGRLSGYATAGLVWLNHGSRICEILLQQERDGAWAEFSAKSEANVLQQAYHLFAHIIDTEIVAPIDSWDLGIYPEQGVSKSTLPVQWLLPHLEFETATQALGRAIEFRLRVLSETMASESLLENELWDNGSTDFWLWDGWLVIKAADGKRLDLRAGKQFSRRILGLPLLAVLSSIRNGTKWGAFFVDTIPGYYKIPPEFEYATGRRAIFHRDAEKLLAFVREYAMNSTLPKPKLLVESDA